MRGLPELAATARGVIAGIDSDLARSYASMPLPVLLELVAKGC